ncbi:energy transducer TonB [Campylobacter sp. FMV-PI01]|uniref:Energy transducer TonB n=1 Tax=Campylobacter portucalensis TaxID=2608384 RepID=A0A6L5WL11_9BACT|nr:energy transducer TonB [Campylobacter portucalensis]MSN97082.1 energy transducer TonB [Campylobacter portucalensis]
MKNSQLSPKQNKNGNLIGFFVSFLVHIGFLYLFLHIPKIEAVSDSVLEMDIAAFDAKTSESVATSQDIPEIPDEILEAPDDEEQEEVEEDVEPVENIEVDEFAEVVKPEPKPEPKKKPEKKKEKQKQKIAAPPKPKALVKGPEQSGDLAAAVGPKNNEPIRLASGGGNPSLWGAILAHIKAHKNYPKIAKRLRQQGTVHVEFLLKSDGTTSGIKIVKSSGFQSLDEAALNTVKKASSKFPKPDKDYILTVPIVYSINVR